MADERTTGRSPRPPRRRRSESWWRARWVLPVTLTLVAIIFVLENREPVTIRLLIPVVVMPQWAALLIMVLIGALIGATLRRRH